MTEPTLSYIKRRSRELAALAREPDADEGAIMAELDELQRAKSAILGRLRGVVVKRSLGDERRNGGE